MKPNRRIVLHIGSPKCGSTYLQRVMLKNQNRLIARGIHYPHAGNRHPGNAAAIAELTAQSLDDMFAHDCHTVVLSHEDLLPQPPRGRPLAALCEEKGIAVQVISFLRPFNQFIYGDYSQFMKQKFPTLLNDRLPYGGRSFEEFSVARSRTISMAAWLNTWNKIFAQTPLVLDNHSRIRDVLESMLDLPPDMDWEIAPDQVNRSLRVSDCEALAAALMDTTTRESDLRAMFKAAHHQTEGPDTGRTPERDRWIEALFLDSNQNIYEHFGLDNRLDQSQPYR